MRRQPDGTPGPLVWAIAVVSLILPWAGLALLALAAWSYAHGEPDWPWLAAGGIGLIVLDVVIDFVWSHPQVSRSDLPDLNLRGEQLVGRSFTLAEPIAGGLGKIRSDDTLWQVEGPDLPAGTRVRVVAARGMRLRVEPLH